MDNNEIRILIAEKIMDWERWTCKDFNYEEAVLMPPGTKMGATWRRCGTDISLEPNGAAGVPDYPNDLLAAWQVEAQIDQTPNLFNEYISALTSILQIPKTGGCFSKGEVWAFMRATPKQRCLAALQAVGVEVQPRATARRARE